MSSKGGREDDFDRKARSNPNKRSAESKSRGPSPAPKKQSNGGKKATDQSAEPLIPQFRVNSNGLSGLDEQSTNSNAQLDAPFESYKTMENKDEVIANLKNQIQQKDATIGDLEKQIQDLERPSKR